MSLDNRYDFMILFDVENGNPNGDPDSDNMPRVDYETGHGLVTDVCIKRKIRNYIDIVKDDIINDTSEKGYEIYIKENVNMIDNRKKAYSACNIKAPKKTEAPSKKEEYERLTSFMCNNFYDIRAFGGVMTLEYNCGQVRGPVQLNFAKSIDPISPTEVTITKIVTDKADKGTGKNDNMGKKRFIPYGLYKMEGYISASLANKTTKFDEKDVNLLWESILNMFEYDHAASKGKMIVQKLFIFKHESILGNAQSHNLFNLISVRKKENVIYPRSFNDYELNIDRNLPEGVELIEKI